MNFVGGQCLNFDGWDLQEPGCVESQKDRIGHGRLAKKECTEQGTSGAPYMHTHCHGGDMQRFKFDGETIVGMLRTNGYTYVLVRVIKCLQCTGDRCIVSWIGWQMSAHTYQLTVVRSRRGAPVEV